MKATSGYITEVATEGVLKEKVLLEILKNSEENTCARVSFFNKVTGLSLSHQWAGFYIIGTSVMKELMQNIPKWSESL